MPGKAESFSPMRVTGHGCVFGAVHRIFCHCNFRRVRAPSVRGLSALVNGCKRRNSGLLFGVRGSNSCFSKLASRRLLDHGTTGLTDGFYRGNLQCSLAIPFTHCIMVRHSRVAFPFGHFRVRPM